MKKIVLIAAIAISSSFVVSSCSNSSSQKNVSSAITDSSTIYSCTMHQEVISDHPGECPKCGMTLVKQKITPTQKKLWDEGKYVKVKN
ncbi:MAG TPA: heavy metal-binding domain-containing protein [Hanamia sp.]|nr:heavy metal-binding domain-containing protein [Hanamia sp.]